MSETGPGPRERDGRPPREGGGHGFRDREGGSRDREGGFRDRDGPRERGPFGLKQRLRQKARKKARRRGRVSFVRTKVCRFCADPKQPIDYKDPKVLRFFVTETGKLIPRRISGNCARHQRQVTTAVKRARHLALIPFVTTQI